MFFFCFVENEGSCSTFLWITTNKMDQQNKFLTLKCLLKLIDSVCFDFIAGAVGASPVDCYCSRLSELTDESVEFGKVQDDDVNSKQVNGDQEGQEQVKHGWFYTENINNDCYRHLQFIF